jgi:hypothetical protein
MSVLPKASARSCPSSRAMKIATASSIPPGCPPPPSIGGLSSRRLTNTRYPSPCFTRDTAAAVADGIAFLAFKIVITTSATRRVCTCCQSGGAVSPDEERVLGGMSSVCRSGMRLLIVETTTVVKGFPALRLCGFSPAWAQVPGNAIAGPMSNRPGYRRLYSSVTQEVTLSARRGSFQPGRTKWHVYPLG